MPIEINPGVSSKTFTIVYHKTSSSSISDLTGTTWVINDTFSIMPSGYPMNGETGNTDRLYINFISNSNTYSSIEWGDGDVAPSEYNGVVRYYIQSSPTVAWGGSWKNRVYRTIEIIGGTDATNANLISWLQANAVQLPGTDLTGTKWVINSTIIDDDIGDCFKNYQIQFNSNNNSFYYFRPYKYSSTKELYYGLLTQGSEIKVYDFNNQGWTNQAYRTIEALGGTDATNIDLIRWLSVNAVKSSDGLKDTTWQLNTNITNTVPNGSDSQQLLFDFYCDITTSNMSDMCPFVQGEYISPFSTWQELVVQLPGLLEAFGATNVSSTLDATSVSNTCRISAIDCEFWGNSEDGYRFAPNRGWGAEYPNITGRISFTLDGNDCNFNFLELVEAIGSYAAPLFDISTDIYTLGDGFPFEGLRTLNITGGKDVTNSILIAWLEANATQIIEPTGHTLTYSGDLSSYLDVKVNNISVSSGTTINNGDKVEVYLDNSYPNYELLVNGEEITKSNIAILKKDISIEVNEIILPYLTFSSPNSFTLNIVDNKKYWDGTLEYSTDTENWSTWDGTTVLSSTQSGATKYLFVRGSNNTYITGISASSSIAHWVLTGSNISCNGNIETLLDYQTVLNGNHPTMAEDCYAHMFRACISLTTAPNLPTTTLVSSCYSCMFYGCTSLTTAPELPATALTGGCYYQMFYGCTSLTNPAKMAGGTTQASSSLNCCFYMYYNCTSLNIYTSSSGHTAFYKAITYSSNISSSNYQSSYRMFYNCKLNGSTTTTNYFTAGTQYYY